jgi:hypothetical protein
MRSLISFDKGAHWEPIKARPPAPATALARHWPGTGPALARHGMPWPRAAAALRRRWRARCLAHAIYRSQRCHMAAATLRLRHVSDCVVDFRAVLSGFSPDSAAIGICFQQSGCLPACGRTALQRMASRCIRLLQRRRQLVATLQCCCASAGRYGTGPALAGTALARHWPVRHWPGTGSALGGTALERHWPSLALARHGTGPALARHWHWPAQPRERRPVRHWPGARLGGSRRVASRGL